MTIWPSMDCPTAEPTYIPVVPEHPGVWYLREHVKPSGMGVKQYALKHDISLTSFFSYTLGRSSLNLNNLIKLAKVAKISVRTLVNMQLEYDIGLIEVGTRSKIY